MLLNEEERINILNDFLFDKKETNRLILLDMGAKAQLKKVVEWGDEPCNQHINLVHDAHRHECLLCWQSLLGEVSD